MVLSPPRPIRTAKEIYFSDTLKENPNADLKGIQTHWNLLTFDAKYGKDAAVILLAVYTGRARADEERYGREYAEYEKEQLKRFKA
ncbi:hypothetical protein BT69DRAFT_376648 [Atractiella rhizophila]|nr:hypothetical protein BT69DRAFT_376648 [Atractiella rhizophila]